MSILGTRVVRIEDPRFLKGEGTYIGNLPMEGALHLTFVRSPIAHARITGFDASEALSMPGVRAVWTAADIDLPPAPPAHGFMNKGIVFPYLAIDTVRYVGDLVAIVVSEDKTSGTDAAETVIVDYEPLPVLLDMDESVRNENLLHPAAESNIVLTFAAASNDDIFADCEVVVDLTIENQRVAPAPMEVRACVASWDGSRLTQWACSQGAHGARDGLAEILGIDKANVRVITPDVGGGFGAKSGVYPEEILVGWATRKLGVPVRWTETRTENMVSMGHGRAQRQRTRMGGTRDGRITAYRLDLLQDAGAYARAGAVLPFMTRMMAGGVYDIANVQFESHSVVTNTTPTVAYRGAGRPEATAAIERAMDMFAAEIGMDAAEVRRINLIPKFLTPHTTVVGQTYDVGDYETSLDKALVAADYKGWREKQRARRASGDAKQIGIGVSVYVEITGGVGNGESAKVEIQDNGHALVYTGTSPHGQGHATSWAMLASEQTGIPIEDIELVWGDTDLVPIGTGTMGSRSLQQGGNAVFAVAAELVNKAKSVAARLLEASEEDIVLDKDAASFHVAGTPAVSKSWADLAVAEKAAGGLVHSDVIGVSGATFPFGAHVAIVEVDIETGKVRHIDHTACDDAGTVLNPMLLEGQIHGGVAQGAAQALMEEVRYDDDANPITSNLADYAFISAAELPSVRVVHMETPTPINLIGAKGIGESGTIGSTPALQSAVIDALAHLNVRHIDMPTTAEKVWAAVQSAR